MMRKRMLPLLLGALLLLTGCMTNIPIESDLTNVPDPGVRDGPPAPVGDSQSDRDVSVELFLPDPNTLKLTVRVETARIRSGQSKQEAVVEALLRAINESSFHHHSAQPLRLAQVSNAVETSGELVTVNLHTSARLLREEALFALRVALTNTLTALPGINYVNVLIDGKDIGLNFEGTLPTGVLSSYPSGDVTTLWGQMNVQRDAYWDTELQKTASLYYVSEDGKSLISLVRNITFPERDMAEYAKCLLEEMTIVANMEGLRIVVPPTEYYERDPIYERPANSAAGYIRVYLHEAIDGQLATRGSTRAMLASSICYTLTSFIPQLEGVYIYINNEPVTRMELMDGTQWSSRDGLMVRSDFAPFIADMCTVYYPHVDGEFLRAMTRPIPQRLKTQPRAIMRELMKPPTYGPFTRALPETMTDADILGLKIDGDTALINFSRSVGESIFHMAPDELSTSRRNMIYAIVNTLTEIDGVSRVRFYFDGEQRSLDSAQISVRGEFMRNAGIIR